MLPDEINLNVFGNDLTNLNISGDSQALDKGKGKRKVV